MAENEVTLRVQAGKARPKGEGDDDDDRPDLSTAPIFSDLASDARDELDHCIVERFGPVREGQLGRFEPDVTEEDIFERHGGGKYRIQGRTKSGRPIKHAFISKEIAGDPILRSKLARRAYAQMVGADETPAAAGSSMQDVVAMIESTRTSADAERERRAEQEEARHRRELERLKAEGELRAAEEERRRKAEAEQRAADDERRRRAEDEREDRRRKEDDERRRRDKQEADEREERRIKVDAEQRERDRQFQMHMAALTKSAAPAADPIATMLAGVKLAQSFAGGGGGGDGAPADPVTALVSNLPQTVSELGKMFRGEGGAAAAAADPNNLVITGELGAKGNRVIVHLRAQGLSPEAMLDKAFDLLLTTRGTGTQPAQPPPPPRRGPGGRPITTTATTVAPAQPAQAAQQPAQNAQPEQPAQPTGTQPAVYPVATPGPA